MSQTHATDSLVHSCPCLTMLDIETDVRTEPCVDEVNRAISLEPRILACRDWGSFRHDEINVIRGPIGVAMYIERIGLSPRLWERSLPERKARSCKCSFLILI